MIERCVCIVKCKIQTAVQPQHPSHTSQSTVHFQFHMELHCVVGLGGRGGWRERDEGGREGGRVWNAKCDKILS